MSTEVRIRSVFKKINKKNPISGHEWTEHGETTEYEVVGKCGVYARCKSYEKANKIKNELQEFYDKFGL